MCAGGESKDACQGFGGAPLVFRENGLYKQVKIVFILGRNFVININLDRDNVIWVGQLWS